MPIRVLLVDDDPMFQRLWQRAIEGRHELEGTLVASLAEARAATTEQRFDVAVCDFWLSKTETSTELVQELAASGTQVIVLTCDTAEARGRLGPDVLIAEKGMLPLDEMLIEAGINLD